MMKYVVLLTLFAVVAAELAEFKRCEESPESTCVVHEVRVLPCRNPKLCKLKKGSMSSIEFDYTPAFTASKMKAGFFWARDIGDVPFGDFYNADGCQHTPCPVEESKRETFKYSLRLGKKLPDGIFEIKLKTWDENDETKNCCIKTTIKLSR